MFEIIAQTSQAAGGVESTTSWWQLLIELKEVLVGLVILLGAFYGFTQWYKKRKATKKADLVCSVKNSKFIVLENKGMAGARKVKVFLEESKEIMETQDCDLEIKAGGKKKLNLGLNWNDSPSWKKGLVTWQDNSGVEGKSNFQYHG